MYYNSLQAVHALLVLLAAFSFIWSAYLLRDNDRYRVLSPIHIIIMTFYFNIFLVRFDFDYYPRLTKFINIIVTLLAGGMFVYGDIAYYLISSGGQYDNQHSPQVYITYIIIDSINMLVLSAFHYFNYKSHFLGVRRDILVLLGLQYVYILNLLTQVIPLYTESKIALTNDFVFMFWMIFILEERWRRSKNSDKVDVVDSDRSSQASRSSRYSGIINVFRRSISFRPPINNEKEEEAHLLSDERSLPVNTGCNSLCKDCCKDCCNSNCLIPLLSKLSLASFYVLASISMYFYVVINVLKHDDEMLIYIWDCCLLSANFVFYIWTYTTFKQPKQKRGQLLGIQTV